MTTLTWPADPAGWSKLITCLSRARLQYLRTICPGFSRALPEPRIEHQLVSIRAQAIGQVPYPSHCYPAGRYSRPGNVPEPLCLSLGAYLLSTARSPWEIADAPPPGGLTAIGNISHTRRGGAHHPGRTPELWGQDRCRLAVTGRYV